MLEKSYKDCFVAAGIDQVNTELLKLKKKDNNKLPGTF